MYVYTSADDTTLLASADSVESLNNFVNIEFKNVPDDNIPAAKFLGVYFDSSLSFIYQVSCIKKNYPKVYTFYAW